jgi:hypothetical protein
MQQHLKMPCLVCMACVLGLFWGVDGFFLDLGPSVRLLVCARVYLVHHTDCVLLLLLLCSCCCCVCAGRGNCLQPA